MNDFSIENARLSINSEKSKEYFKEVSSSYFNGNNRAAVVTLYSVVISDLLLKLESLSNIYGDSTAQAILDEVLDFQQKNPINPEWEKDLIEQVYKRTGILDNVDNARILALRNDRHLCAHPVIDKDDKLYTPNTETVASHIRNMLESLLLKPPVLSKKIMTTILEDLATKKDLFLEVESFNRYMVSKYLMNLNKSTEIELFKKLWKFVFRLDNVDAETNRRINFRFLRLLYSRNIEQCISLIKSDQNYFSQIADKESTIRCIIIFFSDNEFLYNEFRADVHQMIVNRTNSSPDAMVVSWFLQPTYIDQLNNIKSLNKVHFNNVSSYDANPSAYNRLIKIGITKGFNKEVGDFIIWKYGFSRRYDEADIIFSNMVEPNLNLLSDQQLRDLCLEANGNGQVYDRGQAKEDHARLKSYMTQRLGDGIDFSLYPNTFKN